MPVLSNVFHGENQIAKLYRGSTLLWERFTAPTEPHLLDQYIWVDPSELGLADGVNISSLPDKKGNFNFTQSNAGRQPVFRPDGINGVPAMEFDGVDDSLITSSGPNPGDEYTLFAVVQPSALGHVGDTRQYVNTVLATSSQYALWAGIWSATNGGDGYLRNYFYTSSATGHITAPGAVVEIGQPVVLTYEARRGDVARMYLNGVEVGGGTSSTATFGGYLTIGDLRNNRGICFEGLIGELILYDKVLNLVDRSTTEAYLMGKWLGEAVEIVTDYSQSLYTPWEETFDDENNVSISPLANFDIQPDGPEGGNRLRRTTTSSNWLSATGGDSFRTNNDVIFETWVRLENGSPALGGLFVSSGRHSTDGYNVVVDNRNNTGSQAGFQARVDVSTSLVPFFDDDIIISMDTWYRIRFTLPLIEAPVATLMNVNGEVLSTGQLTTMPYQDNLYPGVICYGRSSFDGLRVFDRTTATLESAVADCANISSFGSVGDKLTLTFNRPVMLSGVLTDLSVSFDNATLIPVSSSNVDAYMTDARTVVFETVGDFNRSRNLSSSNVTGFVGLADGTVTDPVPVTEA